MTDHDTAPQVAQDVTELLHITTQNAANKERAEAEHAFNEYIAHEVRNPVSVAVSPSTRARAGRS